MELSEIQEAVRSAAGEGVALDLSGAGSKKHIGNPSDENVRSLSLENHNGVIEYHPEELVVRVRAGTKVHLVNEVLAEQGQMLAFEPPDHGGIATIGGVISAGLSGSRRPFAGSARDFLLGVGLISSGGDYKEFGGQVMKNVAGYDVSRLVCGAFGTLGVIADVSLKVLPKPEVEHSLRLSLSLVAAKSLISELMGKVSPLSGCCYLPAEEALLVRLSGSASDVEAAKVEIGGEDQDSAIWMDIDRQNPPAVNTGEELWRLSTDPEEPVEQPFAWMDWCFGQRWLIDPAEDPRASYSGVGHWTRFSANGHGEPFSQPASALMSLHKRLKQVFDPNGMFNPGRMYRGI